MRPALLLPALLLTACGSASSQVPAGTKVDRLLVDKSDRLLIASEHNQTNASLFQLP